MALRFTLHSVVLVTDANGRTAQILGPQIGGGSLAVTGTVASSSLIVEPCFVQMKAGENTMVRIGALNAATTSIVNSFPLDVNERDVKYISGNQYISAILA